MTRRIYCPLLDLTCKKHPHLCCAYCDERWVCIDKAQCFYFQRNARRCVNMKGLTPEELTLALIFGEVLD